jgi:hypothetical protein
VPYIFEPSSKRCTTFDIFSIRLAPSIPSSLEAIPSFEKAYIQVPNTGRRQTSTFAE